MKVAIVPCFASPVGTPVLVTIHDLEKVREP